MISKNSIFKNSTGAGYNTSKPKSLYKNEPITVNLTPAILMAGVIVLFVIVLLAVGSVENYSLLLSGV